MWFTLGLYLIIYSCMEHYFSQYRSILYPEDCNSPFANIVNLEMFHITGFYDGFASLRLLGISAWLSK